MFSKIIPSLELDITDLLLDSKLRGTGWGAGGGSSLLATQPGPGLLLLLWS